MLYAVVQEPKTKYRQAYVVCVMFAEAKSKADAVRIANFLHDKREFKAPYAVPVHAGLMLRV